DSSQSDSLHTLTTEELRSLAREELNNEYDSVYILDCASKRYRIYHNTLNLDNDDALLDYDRDLKRMLGFILEEDRETFEKIVSVESLIENLGNENELEIQYRFKKREFSWARFRAKVLARVDTVPSRVIITVKYIDRVTSEEMSRQKILMENNRFLRHCLDIVSSGAIESQLENILELTRQLFDADRAYACDIISQKGTYGDFITMNREGVKASSYDLNELDWNTRNQLFVVMTDYNHKIIYTNQLQKYKAVRDFLLNDDIESVVFSSFYDNGSLSGFFGVDNPKKNGNDSELIRLVGAIVRSALSRKYREQMVAEENARAIAKIAQTNEREKEKYTNVITALSSDYSSIYYYDEKTNTVTPYSLSARINSLLGDSIGKLSYEELTEYYIEHGVQASDKAEMRVELDRRVILDKLKTVPSYTKIFLNNQGKYCEMKAARAKDNSKAFVIGFGEKDKEIRNEKSHDNILFLITQTLFDVGDIDEKINQVLFAVKNYYSSEVARAVAVSRDGTQMLVTSRYPAFPEDDGIKYDVCIPIEEFQDWLERFRVDGAFFDSKDENVKQYYKNLPQYVKKYYNVDSVMSAPMLVNDEIKGFVSIDNPRNNLEDLGMLRVAGAVIYSLYLKKTQSAEEQKTLSIISGTYKIVSYVDLVEDYVHVYSASDRYSGYYEDITSLQETSRRFVEMVVAPEDRDKMRGVLSPFYIKERLKRQDHFTVTFGESFRGEQRRDYEIRFIKASEDGNQVVITIADNTEIMALEREQREKLLAAKKQAEDASKSKGEFLARMSHDIRTPINGVMGMTEIARRYHNDEKRLLDSLDKIDVASKHLLNLVNDVLDMSSIENGKVAISSKPFNVLTFAENCAHIIDGQLEGRRVKLIKDFEGIKKPFVRGDELHLRQIIINILGNAVKFTPDNGEILFRISEKKVTKNRISFSFVIKDTGIGMKPEFIEHIWDEFSQEESSMGPVYKGSGLGMPIAKQLSELMGGDLSVESEYMKGTTFTLDVSFAIDKINAEMAGEGGNVSIAGANLLLVEDNDINIEIAKEILESGGAHVDVAENGSIAVDKFKSSEPFYYDLILMDIMMPVMDGLEATRRIRGMRRDDALLVPIIAMTANAFTEDIQKTAAAGMNEHLSKPVEAKRVLATIASYLEK
ncbi:MAG: ATP-binding protein, partial [Lachnospiraceae bacterium]|nr:ATP-binding protein [Lachnospiraceae bacterium]